MNYRKLAVIVLLFFMGTMIISGAAISTLPKEFFIRSYFKSIHKTFSLLASASVLLHIFMNRKAVRNYLTDKVNNSFSKEFIPALTAFIILIIVAVVTKD